MRILTFESNCLMQMKLDKQFKADHNLITEIPFDFSQLLQKYSNNEIKLGHNPWACYCNAEITDLVSSFVINIQIFPISRTNSFYQAKITN